MKFKNLFFNLAHCNNIIKNINTPACKNCIYYKPNICNHFTSPLNKCTKFGEKNIISDKIIYDYADHCRNDENKCGKKGKFFIQEKNIYIKFIIHKIVNNIIFFIMPFIPVVLYIIYFLK